MLSSRTAFLMSAVDILIACESASTERFVNGTRQTMARSTGSLLMRMAMTKFCDHASIPAKGVESTSQFDSSAFPMEIMINKQQAIVH